MDIEELKLILEAVRSVSGDASNLAIWWIAGHYAASILKALILGSTVLGSVWFLAKGIANMSEWASAGKRVSLAYGGKGYSVCYSSDEDAINEAIKRAGNA